MLSLRRRAVDVLEKLIVGVGRFQKRVERNRDTQSDACELEGDSSGSAAHRSIDTTLILKFSNHLPPSNLQSLQAPRGKEKNQHYILSVRTWFHPHFTSFHSHPHPSFSMNPLFMWETYIYSWRRRRVATYALSSQSILLYIVYAVSSRQNASSVSTEKHLLESGAGVSRQVRLASSKLWPYHRRTSPPLPGAGLYGLRELRGLGYRESGV